MPTVFDQLHLWRPTKGTDRDIQVPAFRAKEEQKIFVIDIVIAWTSRRSLNEIPRRGTKENWDFIYNKINLKTQVSTHIDQQIYGDNNSFICIWKPWLYIVITVSKPAETLTKQLLNNVWHVTRWCKCRPGVVDIACRVLGGRGRWHVQF